MNLTIKSDVEMFEYRHKKFDQCKRSKEEGEPEVDVEIISVTTSHNNTPSLCGRKRKLLERSDTPYSISSESSSSCEFVQFGDRTSTPLAAAKRRKLWPTLHQKQQYGSESRHDDSGIGMTPQKSLLEHSGRSGRSFVDSPGTPRLRHLARLNGGMVTTPTSRIRLQSGSEIDVVGSSTTPSPLVSLTSVSPLPPVTPLPPMTTTPTPPSPPVAVLPKISDDTLRSICKYHGNMVRKFPKKERTPKDQERRNKNTLACRMSRRVKKLEQLAIEEQYREFSQQHLTIVEESMRSAAYLQQLMSLIAVGGCGGSSGSSDDSTVKVPDKKSLGVKKSFTIAYLTGAQDN